MSLNTDQASYGLRDLKLAPMTADPAGGSPSYGSKIDASFIQEFQYSLKMQTFELKGDDKKETKSRLESIEGSFKVGKESFAVMQTVLGGTDSGVSGSSPNQTATYTQNQDDNVPYFLIEGQSCDFSSGSAGDEHVTLFKCIITGAEHNYSQDNPREASYSFSAQYLDSTGDLYEVTRNETKVAITTGSADTTPPTITSATITDGQTNVPVNSSFAFTFSENLKSSSVNTDTVLLEAKSAGTVVAAAVVLANNVITVTPSANLTAATQYQIILTKAIRDLSGNKMAAHAIYDFTTA